MLGRTRRIHFVGIGGIGMSGIAELLANLGYEVTGSDAKRSDVTDRLEHAGRPRVRSGTTPRTSAPPTWSWCRRRFRPDNPEVVEARRRGIPGDPARRDARRADAAALRHRHRRRPRQDDDDVDGGAGARARRARSDGGDRRTAERLRQQRPARQRRLHGRRSGRKRSLVPEAVAVDRGDHEHRSRAHGELRQLGEPAAGVRRVRQQGAVLRRRGRVRRRRGRCASCCRTSRAGSSPTRSSDRSGRRRRPRHAARSRSGPRCDVVQPAAGRRARRSSARCGFAVPGRHNLLNALGGVAVGLELDVPFARIAAALEEFRGAERRFQMRGEERGVMVVDDYGHHPTEIAAVIAAARAGIDRRVVVVFQPHRYTRTSELMREFGGALGAADEVVLTDIYAAGEAPIPGVTIEALADAVRAAAPCPVHVVKSLEALPAAVSAPRAQRRPGDHARRRLDRRRRRPDSRRRSRARGVATGGRGDERQGAVREELPARAGRSRRKRKGGRAPDLVARRRARSCAASLRRRTPATARSISWLSASTLQVQRIAVHGNVRLSSGRGAGAGRRPARHEHPDRGPGGVPAAAARLAVGRRRRAAARAAVDGRSVRLGAAADRAVPARAASCTWSIGRAW